MSELKESVERARSRLFEFSKKDNEHCNNFVSRSKMFAILEAMLTPEPDHIARLGAMVESKEPDLENVKAHENLKARVCEAIKILETTNSSWSLYDACEVISKARKILENEENEFEQPLY